MLVNMNIKSICTLYSHRGIDKQTTVVAPHTGPGKPPHSARGDNSRCDSYRDPRCTA